MATLSNINVGSSPNDGTGDDLRTAFITINNNFQAIDGIFPDIDVAEIEANVTSTGTSTFNILEAGFIGNTGTSLTGNLTGTILTANQPSVTGLGTLTDLTVTGPTYLNSFSFFNDGFRSNGAVQFGVTEIGVTLYNVGDNDSFITANLALLGNCAVTLPNADVNFSRTLTCIPYDPSGATDLIMTVQVEIGAGNIFTTANTNFSSTDIGAAVGLQSLRLISNGQYWISY